MENDQVPTPLAASKPTRRPPKPTDVRRLLSDIPDFQKMTLVCKTAPLEGKTIFVTWDCDWEVRLSPFEYIAFSEVPDDLVLTSPFGEITISGVIATRFASGGLLGGVALSAVLRRQFVDTPALFRCLISCDAAIGGICYPEWLEDTKLGRTWCGLLPLELDGLPLDVYFLDDGPYLVCEGRRESLKEFRRHLGALRMVLTYLTGYPLEQRTCEIVLSSDEMSVSETHWNPGWGPQRTSIHAPIPVTWAGMGHYRQFRDLPIGGKVLISSMISACVQKLLNEPELETALAYIRLGVEAPVEIRGALLSVALESLTSLLKGKGLIAFVPPLDEATWLSIKDELLDVVARKSKEWAPEKAKEANNAYVGGIARLNDPTNQTKLTATFSAFEIELTKEQRDAIKSRNRLLHSGRLTSADTRAEEPDAWKDAYVMEMHLFTALNKLLLKYLGYSGPVYDWGAKGLHGALEENYTEV